MAIKYLGGGIVEGTNTQKTPSQIGSIFLHYDTSGVTGTNPVNQTGGAVLALTDFSGNGDDCSQSTASNKPTYDSDDQNGYPVVKFDGTNDSMSNSGEGQQSETSSSFTWVWVGKTPANSSSEAVMIRTSGSGNDYWKLSGNSTSNRIEAQTAGAYGANGAGFTESGYRGVWAVMIFSFDYSTKKVTSYAGNSSEAVELKTVSTNDYYGGGTNVGAGTTTFLGLNGGNNNQWGDIHLGEVIGFRKALSTTEAEQLGAYLLYKWGITSTNPDDKATITNVPAGTRYHETNTKKVFGRYYAGKFDSSQSWVEKGTAGYLTQDTSLNSSLATGGYNGSAVINTTETFSGGVWSASHTLNEAQRGLHAGGGTSTSAMCAGGNNNSWTNLSSTEKLASGSWASDTALPVARYYTSGGGSPTNFLISHGNNTTQERANSLEYNGTSWSNLSGIGWSCYASATGGNATDGLTFGGNTGSTVTNSAKYDGSSWTSTNALNSARYIHGGDGNSTDAVAYNGAQGSSTLRDNEKFNGTSWASIGNGLHGYSRYGATICGKSSGAIGGFGKANSVYMTSTELWDGTSFSASGNSQSGREYGAGGYAN